jgi:hypothetical protein
MAVLRFAADQKASITLAMIAQTLAAIGGVPAKVLADRIDCLTEFACPGGRVEVGVGVKAGAEPDRVAAAGP